MKVCKKKAKEIAPDDTELTQGFLSTRQKLWMGDLDAAPA